MIGSSSTGLACSSACFIAMRAGELERHLRRVDGVVGAVDEPYAHVLDRIAGDDALRPSPRSTPFSTAGMKPFGITPPLISSTNSKPRRRASSGSISMWQSPNWPRPPVCFLWRPCALAGRGSSPGRARAAASASTSTPKRVRSRSTITSTWTCESPATICSPVCGSRCRSIVGSSSCRRRSAVNTLSSSPLVLRLDRERHHRRRELDRSASRSARRGPRASRRRASP